MCVCQCWRCRWSQVTIGNDIVGNDIGGCYCDLAWKVGSSWSFWQIRRNSSLGPFATVRQILILFRYRWVGSALNIELNRVHYNFVQQSYPDLLVLQVHVSQLIIRLMSLNPYNMWLWAKFLLKLFQHDWIYEWQVLVFVDLLWCQGSCLQFGSHFIQRQEVDVIGIRYLKADSARRFYVLSYDDLVVKRFVNFDPILHLSDSVGQSVRENFIALSAFFSFQYELSLDFSQLKSSVS